VQWTAYRAPLQSALVALPRLAAELQESLERARLDARVHFFGMPTSSGPDRTLAHLWVESPDASAMAAAVLHQERAMAPWQQNWFEAVEAVEWRHLLVKVA
jgi:hypothetical protein